MKSNRSLTKESNIWTGSYLCNGHGGRGSNRYKWPEMEQPARNFQRQFRSPPAGLQVFIVLAVQLKEGPRVGLFIAGRGQRSLGITGVSPLEFQMGSWCRPTPLPLAFIKQEGSHWILTVVLSHTSGSHLQPQPQSHT